MISALNELLGGYFYETWPLDTPTVEGTVERFANEHDFDRTYLAEARDEAKRLKASGLSDPELERLFAGRGVHVRFDGGATTPSGFLQSVYTTLAKLADGP